jgi:hypothetical protein
MLRDQALPSLPKLSDSSEVMRNSLDQKEKNRKQDCDIETQPWWRA